MIKDIADAPLAIFLAFSCALSLISGIEEGSWEDEFGKVGDRGEETPFCIGAGTVVQTVMYEEQAGKEPAYFVAEIRSPLELASLARLIRQAYKELILRTLEGYY